MRHDNSLIQRRTTVARSEYDEVREENERLREALARIENPAEGVMRSAGEVAVNATVEIRGLKQQLWWLAQEIRNAADAINPAPVEAERCLRALADQAEMAEIKPRGGL